MKRQEGWGVKRQEGMFFNPAPSARFVVLFVCLFVFCCHFGLWFVLLPLTFDNNLPSCHRKCLYDYHFIYR